MSNISLHLTKPFSGWTDVYISADGMAIELGSASYLDSVADVVLDAFIQYLNPGNHLPFGLNFDAEGYEFGLIEISEYIYAYTTETNNSVPEITEPVEIYLQNQIINLAESVVKDIDKSIDDWSAFDVFEGLREDIYEKECERNKERLIKKIHILNQLISNKKITKK